MNGARVRQGVLAALMLAALAGSYYGGQARGLDYSVPERFRYYGLPIALSMDRYGLPGYVSYAAISNRFHNLIPIEKILADNLPESLDQQTIDDARRGAGLFLAPADDKGYVTFSRIAFFVFGTNVPALYQTYFAMQLLSVVAFIVAFRGSLSRLFAGVCVMLASLSLVPAFADGLLLPLVATFYDPRIFGAGAVLATLHLGFSCIDGPRPSVIRLLGAAYQCFLIVFAVHMRFDNVMLAAGVVAWVLADALWRWRTRGLTGFVNCTWAIGVLLATVGGFLAWEKSAYHERYFTTNMSHHLVWHNVFIGLALQPAFAGEFEYPSSAARRVDEGGDLAAMKAAARSLLADGKGDEVAKIFGEAYTNPTGNAAGVTIDVGRFFHTDTSDLARYDVEVQRVVQRITAARPWQTVELFAWYKPRYIVAHYLWMLGLTAQPTVNAAGEPSPLFARGDGSGRGVVSLAPLQLLAVGGLGLAWLIARPSLGQLGSALAGAIVALGASMAPLMVTYAAPFLMGTSLLTLSLTLLLTMAAAATLVASRMSPSRRVGGAVLQ